MPRDQQQPILESVRAAAAKARISAEKAEKDAAARDSLIAEALMAKVSGTELAKAAGLHRQRIYQIQREQAK